MIPLIAFALADRARADLHEELRVARSRAAGRAARANEPARDTRWVETISRLATVDEFAEAGYRCGPAGCATA